MADMPAWTMLDEWGDALGTRSGLTAALVLALGWVAGLVLARVAERGLTRLGRLFAGQAGRSGLREPELTRSARAGGRVVFWLVFALAVMGATERLGLPVVTSWLSGVASYLPRILVAILVVVAGMALARAASAGAARAAASSGVGDTHRIARLAELTVMAVTGLVAIEALGIDITFLEVAILVALGGLLLAAALAFGMGARELVADILACHYVLRLYQVGQTLRIEPDAGHPTAIEGRLLRVVPPCVVLQTALGEVAVPARRITGGATSRVADRAA